MGKGYRKPLKVPRIDDPEPSNIYPLPYDVDPNIPAKALQWLKQYHINMFDVVANNLLWSQLRECLIFPYDNAWQGRYFGDNPDHPKWYSQGKLDEVIHGFNLKERPKYVILVEDIVSAIRIGNSGAPVVCLFGSNLSNAKLGRLLFTTDRVIFWLDYDKKEEAIKQALRVQDFGLGGDVIITKQDPKFYSDSEIKEIIEDYKED